MSRRLATILTACALAFVAQIVHAEAGRALYASCAACHGANGGGNQALNAPRLSHLETTYVVAQLNKFKSGVRGGAEASSTAQQMAGMASILADEQAITDVAEYIATLSGVGKDVTATGNVALGADYFNQFCGACHGPKALGNEALNSPRLAGSSDWYLRAQLEAFRTGTRGTHPEDRTGKQMRAMAGVLPDEAAVNAVVAFISSLQL